MKASEAIRTLNARECVCGKPKVRKTAFCGTCYARLTEKLKQGLWQRIGRGFEQAYEAARDWLKQA